MRVLSLLLPLLSASPVASFGFSVSTRDQSPLSDQALADTSLDVPGKNPLTYCADPKDYILDITYVDLDPNPPKPGKTLNITASGVFSKDVEPGAKVALTVKYGLIQLIHQTADLCDQITQVDLKCPLKKGNMSMTHSVNIPQQVPPGKYTVIADVLTEDSEKVTCLESVVYF